MKERGKRSKEGKEEQERLNYFVLSSNVSYSFNTATNNKHTKLYKKKTENMKIRKFLSFLFFFSNFSLINCKPIKDDNKAYCKRISFSLFLSLSFFLFFHSFFFLILSLDLSLFSFFQKIF